jgi:hypothetical protein
LETGLFNLVRLASAQSDQVELFGGYSLELASTGNDLVKLHVGDGGRCGADVLDRDSEES